MRYRPEIDGLRALAVIPVVLFHAGFEAFSGGFVGVDVFFVISGFLITSILLEDIKKNRFSLLDFYERRARRILPGLFLVLAFSIPLSWAYLMPNEHINFSKSLISTLLFFSNIFFWKNTHYFGGKAEEMPLLHTWSLSVEEQFYIAFPLVLLLLYRYTKNKLLLFLIIGFLASFLLTEWSWRRYEMAHFYLTPTRIWELLSGSISALIITKYNPKHGDILSFIGLSAILYSIFIYNSSIPYPSAYTLVPIIGTSMILLFSSNDGMVTKVLSNKLLVHIGLISYSTYLWHQPLLAFLKISFLKTQTNLIIGSICALSFIFGWLSTKFFENPFRDKNKFSRKLIFSFSIIGIAFFSVIGVLGVVSQGFKFRYNEDQNKLINQLLRDNKSYVIGKFDSLQNKTWNNDGRLKILLIGDSYAQDLTNAIFESNLQEYLNLQTIGISSECGNLFIPFSKKSDNISDRHLPKCQEYDLFTNETLLKEMRRADEIWLASHWLDWQAELLQISLENISNMTNAKIKVFGKKDFPDFNPRKYLNLTVEERVAIAEPLNANQIELNEKMNKNSGKFQFIDTQQLMCGGDITNCKIFNSEGYLKTYDGGHLTQEGARYFGEQLKSILQYD